MVSKVYELKVIITARKGEELPDKNIVRDNLSSAIEDVQFLIVDEYDNNNVPVYCNVQSVKPLDIGEDF
jgi:hypothetical protein